MNFTKRVVVMAVLMALALSSMGILTARAADQSPDRTTLQQEAEKAWLGIGISDSDAGVIVGEVVSGSPADDAGLQAGDLILAIDGDEVTSAQMLTETVQGYAPGDEVTLTVRSGDTESDVTVTLGTRPADIDQRPQVGGNFEGMFDFLGMQFEMTDEGLAITSIDDDSALASLGFQEGDIITAINSESVVGIHPRELMQLLRGGETLTFTVLRDGTETEIEVELPDVLPEMGSGMMDGFGDGMTSMMLNLFGAELSLTDEGLLVESIAEDSPLAEAGFQAGDVVTAINGESVVGGNPMGFMGELDGPLTFTVLRDGAEVEIEVDLSDLNIMPMVPGGMGQGFMMGEQPLQLGVQFTTLTADIASEKGLSVTEGALVEAVVDDSPAAEAGLQTGDVITAVDGDQVDEEHTLPDRLAAYEEGDTVTLNVLRGEETLDIEVTLGPNMRGFQFFMPGLPEGHPTIPSQPGSPD
ncbi:MAG TPA: PDZ domain-containing protein, partial [Aggregatilineaceae bacterium]|nr:PDZ domain-containing protein [Aggregatilineaceae bacterium]